MKKAFAVCSLVLIVCAAQARAQYDSSKRIQFPRGGTTAVVRGRVNPLSGEKYKVRARAGQRLIVRLTSSSRKRLVRFTVRHSQYERGPLAGADGVINWEGVLDEDDDYVVSVHALRSAGEETYTLEVTIPAEGDSGGTATPPPGAARSPEEAAKALYRAWKANDRRAALAVATPAAVKALFADKFIGMKFTQCETGAETYCLFDYEAGGLFMIIEGGAAKGYRVKSIDYGVD